MTEIDFWLRDCYVYYYDDYYVNAIDFYKILAKQDPILTKNICKQKIKLILPGLRYMYYNNLDKFTDAKFKIMCKNAFLTSTCKFIYFREEPVQLETEQINTNMKEIFQSPEFADVEKNLIMGYIKMKQDRNSVEPSTKGNIRESVYGSDEYVLYEMEGELTFLDFIEVDVSYFIELLNNNEIVSFTILDLFTINFVYQTYDFYDKKANMLIGNVECY